MLDTIKRYSGYTRFLAPAWAAYVSWLAVHPKTAAWIIVALTVTQFV